MDAADRLRARAVRGGGRCAQAQQEHGAKDVRDAVAATNLKTVVGPVKWGGHGPFKNVSKTPLVLGQWVKGQKYKFELMIVNNQAAPEHPASAASSRLMA